MAKFVPDIKTQRWIVISQTRVDRPQDNGKTKEKPKCPFCYGNEHLTPPELYRVGDSDKDQSGWKVRVIPNKYPITDIHEVIIHSPDHKKDIVDQDIKELEMLLSVYHNRFRFHRENGQVMIFCNHGEHAGASLAHPHSQLVVIPRQINLDALVQEPIMNVIDDNTFFITYSPDFSQWPYEVWIAPKKKDTTFADIEKEELNDLAVILKNTLIRLKTKTEKQTEDFAYNFYIHHAKNWFIRVIPRLIHRAGFELGTGLSVNVVDPKDAALELSKIKI